jgi:phage-related protein
MPDRPLVWLRGEVKSPPFSRPARIEAGVLLRRLQRGELLGMPHSRSLPVVGPRCHELRIRDATRQWRIIYHLDREAVVILHVFAKTGRGIPAPVVETCRRRLRDYHRVSQPKE